MADLPQQAFETEAHRYPVVPRPNGRTTSADPSTGAERLVRLARVIESEVIPRLVLARRVEDDRQTPPPLRAAAPTEEEVVRLAALAIDHELPAALAFVEGVRARGVAIESLYLELLAPAARRLGGWWEADRRSFSEVTIGVWRLQQLLHELNPLFQRDAIAPSADLRALLVTAPGEQHSFGLAMVAEFFRRAGWLVSGGPLFTVEELSATVHREWFAVVGISAGSETRIETVASTIHAIRRASRNRALGILVGGVVFDGHPERVNLVGADAGASDARQAPLQARALLDMLVRQD